MIFCYCQKNVHFCRHICCGNNLTSFAQFPVAHILVVIFFFFFCTSDLMVSTSKTFTINACSRPTSLIFIDRKIFTKFWTEMICKIWYQNLQKTFLGGEELCQHRNFVNDFSLLEWNLVTLSMVLLHLQIHIVLLSTCLTAE